MEIRIIKAIKLENRFWNYYNEFKVKNYVHMKEEK